jgi:hypothetical protein
VEKTGGGGEEGIVAGEIRIAGLGKEGANSPRDPMH